MYTTAYATTACQGFRTDRLANQLAIDANGQSLSENFSLLNTIAYGDKEVKIYGLFNPNAQSPVFIHPYTLGTKKEGSVEVTTMVVDLRHFTKPVRRYLGEGATEFSVSDQSEFMFTKVRASLEAYAALYGPRSLAALSEFPAKIYSTWISETLTRNLGLSLENQTTVKVVCADHFMALFDEGQVSDEARMNDHMRIKRLSDLTDLTAEYVSRVVDQYQSPSRNINEMVENIRACSGGDRLADLSVAVLIGILARSWRGTMGSEMVGVSLEHPPTFLAMIYTSLTEIGVKNTNLAKLALLKLRDRSAQNFIQGTQRIALRSE